MLTKNFLDISKLELKATRDGFGKGLLELGERNPNVVVLCADLSESTRSLWFKEKFPERFIEVGVAEQNMALVASGMAACGKIPFIASYAMFSPGRNWEQIRTTICYNNQPVKIVGAHAGVSVGPDGATHQAIEDIAIMRAIPNMVVLNPCDEIEAKKATIAAALINQPVYLRLARANSFVFTEQDTPFQIGRAEIFKEGKDLTIISCGPILYNALVAAYQAEKELQNEGKNISIKVINSHTIKPLDKETILSAAKETNKVITIEEHQVSGGLGSAVAEFLIEEYPVKMKIIGVADRFGESGEPGELYEKLGLSAQSLKAKIKNFLN